MEVAGFVWYSPPVKNSQAWFSNTDCKYYPCHDLEEMNCLFCFCPLYWFADCGGNYSLTKQEVKDCSGCLRPHKIVGYDEILDEISKRIRRRSTGEGADQEQQPETGH